MFIQRGTGDQEEGFATLVIVMTMVIIIGLIMLGFGQLMRSEQRSALDRQLSTQAYYAAESGVHDAEYAIKNGFTGVTTGCNPSLPGVTSTNVGPNSNVKYTCLSIDTQPFSLEYNPVAEDNERVINVVGEQADRSGTATIAALKFSWQGTVSGTQVFRGSGAKNLPPHSGWQNGGTNVDPGLLEIAITPISGGFTRDSLRDGTNTVYLYPSSGSTTNQSFVAGSGNWGQQGQIINNVCTNAPAASDPKKCNVIISGLSSTQFIVRVRSLYASSDLMLTAFSDNSATNQLRFSGGQAIVDSTGKAQDVLRRIQAHVPLSSSYYMPIGTIDASTICKLLQVTTGGGSNDTCP